MPSHVLVAHTREMMVVGRLLQTTDLLQLFNRFLHIHESYVAYCIIRMKPEPANRIN